MRVWMIWLQGDDATWLQAAWDDESTAENTSGWQEELDKARELAFDNKYEMRIQQVTVPGVFEMFDIAAVDASAIPEGAA